MKKDIEMLGILSIDDFDIHGITNEAKERINKEWLTEKK